MDDHCMMPANAWTVKSVCAAMCEFSHLQFVRVVLELSTDGAHRLNMFSWPNGGHPSSQWLDQFLPGVTTVAGAQFACWLVAALLQNVC